MTLRKVRRLRDEKSWAPGADGKGSDDQSQYKTLQKFRYKRESRELGEWFEEGVTLYGAWTHLGLDKISTTRVMQTDAYKTYVYYVKKLDDMHYWHKNSIFEPPIEYSTDAQFVLLKYESGQQPKDPGGT
ncbi:hypothetical protein GQ600_26538 [Phytophthora cactorum]|nr:hypothetical protein GQ600_26538 [Phytophthora cactorum]